MKGNNPVNISASGKIQEAMLKADMISRKISGKEIIVTSLLDGVHSKNSFHYSGNAVDLRTWIYTGHQIKTLVKELQLMLGSDYDVIDEEDHIHIEYDPKV
jgi:hypothetical protein